MADENLPDAPVSASTAAPLARGMRLAEIDLLRGLVIVLMALDHVRDYLHVGSESIDPLDPASTTPLLYATRWLTHLCAPTFVFLAGVSAWLQASKGKSGAELARFLATRGLWLVFCELTVLSFGWSFAVPYVLFLQVIWAIGWSMVVLAVLVALPRGAVLAIGLAIVVGHDALGGIAAGDRGALGPLWTVLLTGGIWIRDGQLLALIAYPVLPWLGLMAVGYGAGPLFLAPAARRDRALTLLGLAMLAGFAVLRGLLAYGDPAPGGHPAGVDWHGQPTAVATVMAFLNVHKNPPSLQFVLVTLGLVFVAYPWLARLRGAPARVLATFGAVPFFLYVLHVYAAHGLALAANALAGHPVAGLYDYIRTVIMAPERMQGLGFALPWVYVGWAAMLAALYPACRWWAGVKRRRREAWLSYL